MYQEGGRALRRNQRAQHGTDRLPVQTGVDQRAGGCLAVGRVLFARVEFLGECVEPLTEHGLWCLASGRGEGQNLSSRPATAWWLGLLWELRTKDSRSKGYM